MGNSGLKHWTGGLNTLLVCLNIQIYYLVANSEKLWQNFESFHQVSHMHRLWHFLYHQEKVGDTSNTLATWYEELTHWNRPWCWERLKAGREGDDRGWDVWMASPTRWTGVWASSRSWWWTGKPGVLPPMRPQRVRHDWETELKKRFHVIQW